MCAVEQGLVGVGNAGSNGPAADSRTRISSKDLLGEERQKKLFANATANFEELRPKLRRMAQRLIAPLQGRIGTEDVIQSGYHRLLENLSFKTPMADEKRQAWIDNLEFMSSDDPAAADLMRSWIYKKVWSECHTELRKHRTATRDSGREIDWPDESIADVCTRIGVSTMMGVKETVDLIRKAIKPIEFEIISLHIVDELSYVQIAHLFDQRPDAIRQRHVRALRKIRKVVASPFSSSG